jgi:shikimate dehydrogenase
MGAATADAMGEQLRPFEQTGRGASDTARRGLPDLFGRGGDLDLRAGLVGRGIQGSRTPHMHQAEGRRLGLRYGYDLLDFDRLGLEDAALGNVVRAAAEHGYAGLNVTHPFKQGVLACLDEISADAAAIGAVNTVVFRAGKAIGHNTDCWGFAESFRRGMGDVPLGRVLLLGAGGAGMAVGRALLELGAGHVATVDTSPGRAAALAGSLGAQFGMARATAIADLSREAGVADGLVNTTPVGMAKYPGMPVPRRALRRDLWVADIVYFPAETELLRAAGAIGSRTLPGRGMAIFQAVKAFELFTGRVPDAAHMSDHFGPV